MFQKIALAAMTTAILAGCASVDMESAEADKQAKTFSAPTEGKAGLYIYRSGSFGASLKKDIWVDGDCIGETARNVFFYTEVDGGKEHKVSTESEFSPNDLSLATEAGKHYFVRQYIKVGLFVGGAGLETVEEAAGKEAVSELSLAKKGSCSK